MVHLLHCFRCLLNHVETVKILSFSHQLSDILGISPGTPLRQGTSEADAEIRSEPLHQAIVDSWNLLGHTASVQQSVGRGTGNALSQKLPVKKSLVCCVPSCFWALWPTLFCNPFVSCDCKKWNILHILHSQAFIFMKAAQARGTTAA